MEINRKVNRKNEEVEDMKKDLVKKLEETCKNCVIHCQYKPDLDQFIVIRYVDKKDDNAHVIMYYDYDEALNTTCDVTIV